MSAWGMGVFDNDPALDWAGDLPSLADVGAVANALDAVAQGTAGADTDRSCIALAAAEVVAALGGHPSPDLPAELESWTFDAGTPDEELVRKARVAVDAVLASSELRALWEETEEYEAWRSVLLELKQRL